MKAHRGKLLGQRQKLGIVGIDFADRRTKLDQVLLLFQNDGGVFLGIDPFSFHDVEQWFDAGRRLHLVHAFARERLQIQADAIPALLELFESLDVALNGVRHRLGEALRVHQRIAGNRDASGVLARVAEVLGDHDSQEDQRGNQQQGQHRILPLHRQMTDQRQGAVCNRPHAPVPLRGGDGLAAGNLTRIHTTVAEGQLERKCHAFSCEGTRRAVRMSPDARPFLAFC